MITVFAIKHFPEEVKGGILPHRVGKTPPGVGEDAPCTISDINGHVNRLNESVVPSSLQ